MERDKERETDETEENEKRNRGDKDAAGRGRCGDEDGKKGNRRSPMVEEAGTKDTVEEKARPEQGEGAAEWNI